MYNGARGEAVHCSPFFLNYKSYLKFFKDPNNMLPNKGYKIRYMA